MHDLRLAFRQLTKSRGFALVAIVTLGLGIGLNTSMFSLMNRLLLRPLPYPDRDQLVRVFRTTPQSQTASLTAPDYLELERESQDFIDLAAYRLWGFTLAQEGRPAENLNALRVSADFFPTIGLQPEVGRVFTPDEDRPGNQVIMLSYGTWQAHFGGDPEVVGSSVRIDGEPTTIVGVMPEAFSSIFLWGPGDAFRPMALTDGEKVDRANAGIQIIGRYRKGMSLDQVNARLTTIGRRLAENRPRESSEDGLRAVSMQSTVLDPTSTQLIWLLLALSGFVLLIACGNLANLQLARAVARARDFAICAALGASRSRLLRPLLTESLLLALAGGVFGVLVAEWSNAWISHRVNANSLVPLNFAMSIDWRVLGFALGISAATGLLFGIVPAWLMSRVRVNETLKGATRGSTADRSHHRFRHLLIVGQFALALVLLAGAGLFVRALDKMLAQDLGWNSDQLLQCVLSPPQAQYSTPEQTYAFYTQLQERLGSLPSVENVAVGWTVPLFQFLANRNYVVEGRDPPPAGHEPLCFVNGVTPSFVDTLDVELVAGRNFSAADGPDAPLVAIINETMAQTLFPNENPIGRRIGGLEADNRNWMEIVGVVRDMRFAVNVAAPATRFQVFRPLAQETWNYVTVAVRTPTPEKLAEPLRREVAALDPNLPVQNLMPAKDLIKIGTNGLSMVSDILAGFALLGLFLAALGLYGVIARLVAYRTPEFGVRMALGAQGSDIVRLVLGTGLRLVAYGTTLGLLLALALAWLLTRILPEMPAQDFWAVGVVTFLLVGVALIASWLPARHAARINPVEALRAE